MTSSLTTRLLITLFLLSPGASALHADTTPLHGAWQGELTTPSGNLPLLLSIAEASAEIAVPSRGIAGIPVTQLTLQSDAAVQFEVPADGAVFSGRLTDKGLLKGHWQQAGQRIPVTFERSAAAFTPPERRQTPKPPFPYQVREVSVSAGVTLACTLTQPPEPRATRAGVVLLTVAGPNDRNQTHSGHKPYLVLADHLTRAGMAVLRCDDRGVGGSAGNVMKTSIEELTADALAMVAYLAGEAGAPVGIIGNSEGSVIATLAAREAPGQVAFAVLLGGVGVTGSDVIRARLLAQARAGNTDEATTQHALERFDSLVLAVRAAGGVGVGALEQTRPDLHAQLVEIARAAGSRDMFLPQDLDERVALFAGPWYYGQLTLDGAGILEQVTVPVLALTGSNDRTNLPGQNLPAIREALERGGNPDYAVLELPNLNHVFQTSVEGGMAEYARLEETFAPIALSLITEWIAERT